MAIVYGHFIYNEFIIFISYFVNIDLINQIITYDTFL